MASPIVHPRKQKQRRQFYPHKVSIGTLTANKTGNTKTWAFEPLDGHTGLAAAYGAKSGANPAMFQVDASTGESILLQGNFPNIEIKAQAVLTTSWGDTKYFRIVDVIFADGKTMLVCNPWK